MNPTKLIKRLLLISVILGSLLFFAFGQSQQQPQEANRLMHLEWDSSNPVNELVSQRLYLYQSNVFIQKFELPASATARELTNIFTNFPNGVYTINLTAVGKSALESPPSSNLWVFWYGSTPNSPANLTIRFSP